MWIHFWVIRTDNFRMDDIYKTFIINLFINTIPYPNSNVSNRDGKWLIWKQICKYYMNKRTWTISLEILDLLKLVKTKYECDKS